MNPRIQNPKSKIQNGPTVTITDKVAAITHLAVLLERFRDPFARHNNQWIPRTAIADSDTDWEEISVGDEITIEVYDWKARELGLA